MSGQHHWCFWLLKIVRQLNRKDSYFFSVKYDVSKQRRILRSQLFVLHFMTVKFYSFILTVFSKEHKHHYSINVDFPNPQNQRRVEIFLMCWWEYKMHILKNLTNGLLLMARCVVVEIGKLYF